MGAVAVLAGVVFLGWRVTSAPSIDENVASDAASAQGGDRGGNAANPDAPTTARRTVTVYVSGAVAKPGMYRLPTSLRVSDAVAAAGGVLGDADLERMPNLAGKLTDGKQIRVPRLRGARSASTSSRSARVDINSASVADLEAVPGVDPTLAQAIVTYRGAYGPFATLTELKTMLGVDAATLAVLRRYLIVGS